MKLKVVLEYQGTEEFVTEVWWGEDPDKGFSREAWNDIHDLMKKHTVHGHGGWASESVPWDEQEASRVSRISDKPPFPENVSAGK